jgi:hypothetical protein
MKLEGFKKCVSKRCGRIIHTETEHYYEFDKPYILVLLRTKVHPKLITDEAKEAFDKHFKISSYRYDQLKLLKEGIIHLFSTLRQAAEIRRDFTAYDDYMSRESTFVTLVNIELEKREGSK